MSEVLTTIFSRDIQQNLFPENEFYRQSRRDADVDINAVSVEIPQAGAAPTVGKNPSTFPLTIGTRTDDKLTYSVDLYYTSPIHVTDLNEAITNYDKRQDIIRDHTLALNTEIASDIAHTWAPAGVGFVKQTTGTTNRLASAPSATGNRKKVTKTDVLALFEIFNKWNMPLAGRCAVFPPEMYADLLEIDDFISADKMGKATAVPTGSLGLIYGFSVYMRNDLPIYTEAAAIADIAKKDRGAAGAATDNLGALFWHRDYVRHAQGQVKVYADYDKPEYLGSIFNAAVRAGGTYSRADKKGVAVLVQDNA